ncbi:MAG: Rrf2 family transcriptional regulator [Acidobacteriota bacterium]|nr:Rrf2 family transcriptional regulator [Acidobacteriota bacterium]
MQLNVFTDYACRVLIYAAAHDRGPCTSDEIAEAFGISRHHLVKVINELQHLGFLETRRGRAGGIRLARAPERIGLGEVIRRTEGTLALVECFDRETDTCPLTPACGLRGALKEAFEAFFATLDRYTLADLVAQPRWIAQVTALFPPGGSGRAS